MVGCNSFGSGKLVQQLQNENERLLTEFRAERERREEAERLNSTLEAKLSESEKLLARQTMGSTPNRVSSLQPALLGASSQLPTTGSSSYGASNSGLPRTTTSDSEVGWQRRAK
jgi:molecular chaperone DnaK (HSP70)